MAVFSAPWLFCDLTCSWQLLLHLLRASAPLAEAVRSPSHCCSGHSRKGGDCRAGRAILPPLFTREPVVKEAWCLQEAARSLSLCRGPCGSLSRPPLKTFVICQSSAGPPRFPVRDQVQGLNKLASTHTGSSLSANAKAGDKCTWELKHFRKGRKKTFCHSQIVNRKCSQLRKAKLKGKGLPTWNGAGLSYPGPSSGGKSASNLFWGLFLFFVVVGFGFFVFWGFVLFLFFVCVCVCESICSLG